MPSEVLFCRRSQLLVISIFPEEEKKQHPWKKWSESG